MTTQSAAAAKAELRSRLRAARAQRTAAEQGAAAAGIARVLLSAPEVAAASVVAAYVDTSGEPGTLPLLSALADRGVRVLLPVQKRDGELDWASYAGPGALAAGPHDIAEPTGDRLGPEAIAAAEVIVVPALAVDQAGHRLGQGGGGYDRALTRSAPGVLTVAALHDDEFLDDIPTEPHDISVLAAATPTRLIRCRE